MISINTGGVAPTFDHPLEMLHACHGKILHQCDTLKKLNVHLGKYGCDTQVQQAAQGILRYFNTAGQFHHQDEEENLFPVLRASSQEANSLLQRLLSEHVVMLSAWDALRGTLEQLAEGITVALNVELMKNFIRSYTDHIAVEEAELLPLAARVLTVEQLKEIGINMATRRGVQHA